MLIKVAIVGATGRQGSSTINALLRSKEPRFEAVSLVRPGSLEKDSVRQLKDRGITIVQLDLRNDPQETLVSALAGIDAVLSFLPPNEDSQRGQIALATAAKKAGVKRFVINAWGTVSPPKGVLKLREIKQDILDHVQKIYLPWTWIDVGFWHDVLVSRIPSGRLDRLAFSHRAYSIGKGTVPCAMTSVDDIGTYVTRIIADERTINRFVFAYGELQTQEGAVEVIERLSGEQVTKVHFASETLIRAADSGGLDHKSYFSSTIQYFASAFVRGDNQPDKAKYLGYVDAKELYPDFVPITFEESVLQALNDTSENKGVSRPVEFWDQFENILRGFEVEQNGEVESDQQQ